jgi:hypothetical protein
MTEAEWLACDDLCRKVDYHLAGYAPRRTLGLFNCACCRLLWEELPDVEIQRCLSAGERYADSLIRTCTASKWYHRARAALSGLPTASGSKCQRIVYEMVVKAIVTPELGHVHQMYLQAMRARSGRKASARRQATERGIKDLAMLVDDIFGNPFRAVTQMPAYLVPAVLSIAQAAYEERKLPSGHLDPARLAVLSDALEDAGCTDADLLAHLRSPGPHVRGCWALDLILGMQ